MARRRTPLWKLKSSGNYRPGKHGGRVHEMDLGGGDGMPPPPDFIADHPARLREWNRLVLDPQYSPVLSPLFMGLVVEYVCLTGDMMADPAGMTTAERRHRSRLASELLLTPASQGAHPLPAPARTTKNKFDF